jgi:hypothetical protein
MPVEPKLSLPGLAFAYFSNSARSLAGMSLLTTEDVRHVGDEQDREEVLLRVERQVLVERLVDRERAGPAEQKW